MVSQPYVQIKAFETKLQIFQRHLSQTKPCTAHFPVLQEIMDSFLQDNMGAQTERHIAAVRSLSVEFKEHFWDFAATEKDMYPPPPSLWTPIMLCHSCSWTSLSCSVTMSGVVDTRSFLLFTCSWIKAGFQKCEHLQRNC